MKWQPIATVPYKEDVLVCMTHNLDDETWETLQWVDYTLDGKHWPIWSRRIDLPFPPTHWMPLPAPPVFE